MLDYECVCVYESVDNNGSDVCLIVHIGERIAARGIFSFSLALSITRCPLVGDNEWCHPLEHHVECHLFLS